MRYLIGKKVGMTQLFDTNGKVIPVTVIHAEPNKVVSVRKAKDNQNYVQVGYETVNEKKLNKAQLGVFKKAKVEPKKYLRQFTTSQNYNVGDEIKVSIFKAGEYVDVQGTTKGHGFTGAIFRWNFKVGPLGHGAGYPHRYQGSVAFGRGGSQAQRVPKGKKMSGHYGCETNTTSNLTIVDVLPDRNLILVMGTISGTEGSLVIIKEAVKKIGKTNKFTMITKANKAKILRENEALEDKEALYEANQAAEEAAAKQEAEEQAQKEAEAKAKQLEEERLQKQQEALEKAEAEKAAAEKAKELNQ